jgi:hypothetical protein
MLDGMLDGCTNMRDANMRDELMRFKTTNMLSEANRSNNVPKTS